MKINAAEMWSSDWRIEYRAYSVLITGKHTYASFDDGKDQAVPVTDMIRAVLSGKPMPDGVIPIAPDAAEELWENAATPLANGGLVARVVSGPMEGTTTLTAAQAAEWCEWLTGEPCHNAADGCPENDAV